MNSRAAIWIFAIALALPMRAVATFDSDLEDPEDAAPTSPAKPLPSPLTEATSQIATTSAKSAVSNKGGPFSEDGPRDLMSYIRDKKTPSYIRIDVKGHNVRKSADFSAKLENNVDFKTKGGDLFVVASVQPMAYGAAVQVHVDDDLRWIYVPYDRKDDFQFCESEACFTAMAKTLDYLIKGSGVGVSQAESCGVSAGPEGLILPQGAATPHKEPDLPVQPPVKPVPVKPLPAKPPVIPSPPVVSLGLRAKPLWENAKGATGVQWTKMMSDSLDKYGQGLLNQKSLSDARTFCPNFSRLDTQQKKEFWIHLFNGIARYESNFKTGAPAFDEDRQIDVYRGPIKSSAYSMGLFQLSYSSAPGYRPGCRIDYNKDRGKDVSDSSLTIYDPKIQMDCAVTVMNRWVSRDGGVGLSSSRGGARFWSTLRSSNPATSNVIASLKRDTACWK